jgi:hypothetical protein
MKRQLPETSGFDEERKIPKRQKLAHVVPLAVQEMVMENKPVAKLIGAFLDPLSANNYCQTARINLFGGPFVHPNKVGTGVCFLMGCYKMAPDNAHYLCYTHRCGIIVGKGIRHPNLDPESRFKERLEFDAGARTITWSWLFEVQKGIKRFDVHGMRISTLEAYYSTVVVWMKWLVNEKKEGWTPEEYAFALPILRRFIKNRRRFIPGKDVQIPQDFPFECDQLGLIINPVRQE